MNLVSIQYILFLSFVYAVYWTTPDRFKKFILVSASAIFYGFIQPQFLIHLIAITLLNFLIVKALFGRKGFLFLIVTINLINLVFFKYIYFLLSSIGDAMQIQSLSQKSAIDQTLSQLTGIQGFQIIQPLFISYYTFQFISLGFDLKNKVIDEVPTLSGFFSYIFLFPIMTAGPILRYKETIPEIQKPTMEKEDMIKGIWLLFTGFLKKGIIAEELFMRVAEVFSNPASYSWYLLSLNAFFFAFYLYFDFSGLTDIARGSGRLLGLNLPINFRAPFFMDSFADFWRRWHLSFSTWIRDYIYIPLGGSRKGEWRTYLNFIITFSLGGLWHGPNMNFLLWGFLTGFFISAEKKISGLPFRIFPDIPYLTKSIRNSLTLFIYSLSWIFFFAQDLGTALSIITKILTLSPGTLKIQSEIYIYSLICLIGFHILEERADFRDQLYRKIHTFWPIYCILITLILVSRSGSNVDFFYSKF